MMKKIVSVVSLKKMSLVLMMVAMSLGACVAEAPESESDATEMIAATPEVSGVTPLVEVPEALILRRGTSLPPTSAAATCTVTYGPCTLGRCEFPVEPRQNGSQVCCNEGVCTVKNFVVCGC